MNASQTTPDGLKRGERAPDFVLPAPDGTLTRFYGKAGGTPIALLFCSADAVAGLLDFCVALDPDLIAVFMVLSNQPDPAGDFPFPVFADPDGKVRQAYRLNSEEHPALFILDPNLRVLKSFALQNLQASAQEVSAVLAADLPPASPRQITTQAPVLLIPRVLDPEICRHLIQVWQEQGHEETGVEQSHQGRRKDTLDHADKRRRDHVVRDPDLLRALSATIARRILPEVQRAFAFRATRFEGFKIACYDAASQGFFRPHRDNLSPSTAHRRFALTLNLNADYKGGYLQFPEYGPNLYHPQPGGALIFPCAHIHAVTEVTQGRRFALLSFLFGEENVRPPTAPEKKAP